MLKFKWIGGACWSISFSSGHQNKEFNIVCDPVLCPKDTVCKDFFTFKRLTEPVFDPQKLKKTDLWLITHNHKDHLDDFGLEFINEETSVISHKNARKKIDKRNVSDVTYLNWGDERVVQHENMTLTVEAVPAFHTRTRFGQKIAGGVNGYLLTINDESKETVIYVTSDTLLKSKVIDYLKNRTIDVMIPNFGAAQKDKWYGPLTLDKKMLSIFISELNPKLVLPVHFKTFDHYIEGEKELLELNDSRIKIIDEGDEVVIDDLILVYK